MEMLKLSECQANLNSVFMFLVLDKYISISEKKSWINNDTADKEGKNILIKSIKAVFYDTLRLI